MCDCLTELQNQIKEQTGDEHAEIDWIISGLPKMKMFPRLTYSFHKKKEDGTLQKNKTVGTILPTCCPFCGKEYADEKTSPDPDSPDSDSERPG